MGLVGRAPRQGWKDQDLWWQKIRCGIVRACGGGPDCWNLQAVAREGNGVISLFLKSPCWQRGLCPVWSHRGVGCSLRDDG